MKPWFKQLHWQIILGLVLGLVFGVIAAKAGWADFCSRWIAPFGIIFINLLKFIAVPLVLASLILGVASLSDMRRLSRLGGKTMALYIGTTAVAITIGLVVVNIIQPGRQIPAEMRADMMSEYQGEVESRRDTAAAVQQRIPLQPLVDAVPDNFFGAASSNQNMLQMVVAALLLGIAVIQIPREKSQPFLDVVDSLMEIVIRLVHLIMLIAPYGVFALIVDTITTLVGEDPGQLVGLLRSLGIYCFAVVLGLAIHVGVFYIGLLKVLTPVKFFKFVKAAGPAQLLAFSTSSSGATLPVTMKQAEQEIGVSEEVSSFVLPLGATINMDGTAMYQAIAAVFIAQVYGMDLSLGQQLTIVFTALLASIGTAAVPGAGIIMLVIILQAVEVPMEGIALILGVDRPLDMLRTATNVTGDLVVSSVMAHSEGQLGDKCF